MTGRRKRAEEMKQWKNREQMTLGRGLKEGEVERGGEERLKSKRERPAEKMKRKQIKERRGETVKMKKKKRNRRTDRGREKINNWWSSWRE